MSEFERIQQTVAKVARRCRMQAGWHGFWRGLLVGSSLWLLVLIAYKLLPLPVAVLGWAAGVALLLSWLGLIVGFARRPGLLQTARWMDDRHHFQERLSTALELAENESAGRWRELVLADAAAQASSFDHRAALPFQLPRLARWCLPVLALAAGLSFIPEYRSEAHRQRQQEMATLQETGHQLIVLVRRELAARSPALESTRAAFDAVEELGEQMATLRLDRHQALRELARVTDQVENQLRELGREPALSRLTAGHRSSPSPTSVSPGALQQRLEALQESLGRHGAEAAALESLRQELHDLRQAADGLARAEGAAAEALRQELALALSELDRQAEALGLELAGLGAALQGLADGRMDQAEDGESLLAMLQGLHTGQMCVGNGLSWGECLSLGVRAGFRPDSSPGRGGGTWNDDDPWIDPVASGSWDTSVAQRPNFDPRGFSDQGAGFSRDAFTPTQLPGQLSPGGPLPSLTLRGVSLPGQSRVQFEEQVAAAQRDAQSALSQHQVPRAYRGVVRDYFDDLN